MTAISGVNYTKEYVNVPSEQGAPGEMGGRVKCLFDSIASAATGDVLTIGKIPAGARILRISSLGLGTLAASSVAAGDKLTAETVITVTAGTAGSAPFAAWVEYLLD